MHPMFKELFIDTDAEDLVAEENWRRRVRRSQRAHGRQARRPSPAAPFAAVTGDLPADLRMPRNPMVPPDSQPARTSPAPGALTPSAPLSRP
jgi:hypothetical protein